MMKTVVPRLLALLVAPLIACPSLYAVSDAEKKPAPSEVLSWSDGAVSPKAKIDVVRWLEGNWEGKLDDNAQQNMIYAPVSGQMPGFVRAWTKEGMILFYEIEVFAEVGDSIECRVKHFSSELVGWEGKDDYIRRRLVAVTDKAVFFDGITFEKDGPDRHIVHFRLPSGGRKGQIIVVNQTRVK